MADENTSQREAFGRASRRIHVEVGHLALDNDWISVDELQYALANLPPCREHEVETLWVELGLLTTTQARQLVDSVLDTRRTQAVRPVTAADLAAHAAANSAAPLPGGDSAAGAIVGDADEHLETIALDATQIHPRAARRDARADREDLDPATTSVAETMMPRRNREWSHSSDSSGSGGVWPSGDERAVADSDELTLNDGALRERYKIEEEVGRGGSGRVYRAFDRALGRVVAMKILRQHDAAGSDHDAAEIRLRRFIQEARGTGRLEHPNIIPIYDVGVLPDGRAYYTMKLLRRRSLRGVLRRLAEQDEETRREYRLGRLLGIFLPVCQAIAYAHSQGVVHRDLKPNNIMLGDYGEVLVTDWGLARSLLAPAEKIESSKGQRATLGTPAYMPPEQALGKLDEVDEISDIYGLGAILYEILALQPPYDGPSALAVLDKVAEGHLVPPSRRASGRHVPRSLEDICMRAMAHDRSRRFETALELHDEVQAWTEGQQSREAMRKVYLGKTATREYFRTLDEIDALTDEVRTLRDKIADWAPVEHKRPLWRVEDSLEQSWTRLARNYSDAVRAFTQALAYNPNADDARRGLADIYWSRFEQAERRRNVVDRVHFDALIRQMDREGRYADRLDGYGLLTLTADPEDARVTLLRQRERSRVMELWEPDELGPAPIHIDGLEMGSYLARVEHPGHETALYPIHIERCGHWQGHITLMKEGAVPDGFVYIPSGPYIAGGDPDASDAEAEHTVELPSYLLGRDLVTFAEYLEFLDALQPHSPEEAARRAPQTRDGDGILAHWDEEAGRWRPNEILIEGEARTRYPQGEGHELRLPVMCIDVYDALAYCAWRSERDGIDYRLPTHRELEKAARGVDGRCFPWGDHFDATFCKMRLSRPEMPQPEPIGVFETDVSVYGVRDLAGTLQNWARDERWHDAFEDADDGAEPIPGCLPGERVPESCFVSGGSWNHFEDSCRAASRVRVLSVGRSVSVGLRLAIDVD